MRYEIKFSEGQATVSLEATLPLPQSRLAP
jgi:hypothetical protein